MKIKNILMSAAMVGTLASCNLDEVYYSQTTVDNFVENESNVNQLLSRPFAHWRAFTGEHRFNVNEYMADAFMWPARSTGDGYDGAARLRLLQHKLTEVDDVADTNWKEAMQGIARCLDVMEKLEALDYAALKIDPEKKAGHLGQMQALMGYFYMAALDWYGGVPIYESSSDPLKPRTTAKETFDYTEQLLKDAVAGLPVRQSVTEEATGFLRKGAAAMLLAQLYFNAEVYIGTPMYTECEKICEDIIAGVYGPYELEDFWQNVFNFDNKTSTEILWAVPADWAKMKNDWYVSPFYPYEVYKYFGINTDFTTWAWNGACLQPSRDPQERLYKDVRPDIKLGSPYEKFDDADLRKKLYRYKGDKQYEGMFLIGKLQDSEHPERACPYYRSFKNGQTMTIYDHVAAWSTLKENGGTVDSKADLESKWEYCADEGDGVRLVKYPIPDEADAKLYGTCYNPHVRLTETYYTLAECKWRRGDAQGAADLINQVRKRNFEGGVDPNPVTASNLDKYRLLDEWLIEFLGEGRRRIDLIRLGAFENEEWWDHQPTNNTRNRRLPLGDSVIGSNNLLKQNPGYGGNELSPDEI